MQKTLSYPGESHNHASYHGKYGQVALARLLVPDVYSASVVARDYSIRQQPHDPYWIVPVKPHLKCAGQFG